MTYPQLNLLVIRARDMEQAAQFYRALGLTFERHQHGHGPVHYATATADWVFEIYPHLPDSPATSAVRFGFRVANLDQILRQIVPLGAQLVSAPKPSPWGYRAVITDLDGHKVELIDSTNALE